MDFSPPQSLNKKESLTDTVNDRFVDELKRVALEQHKKHHRDEHIEAEPQLEVVQNSFDQIEGELSELIQEVPLKNLDESVEYKRITEQTGMALYGAGSEAGGAQYGMGSHEHGASATFEATCCGERIVVRSTPSGKIKATNLTEQAKQYQEQQTGGGYGKSEGAPYHSGDQSAFRGYQ